MMRSKPLPRAGIFAIVVAATVLLTGCETEHTLLGPTLTPLTIELGKCYDVSLWGIPIEMPCHAASIELSDTRLLVGDTLRVTLRTYAGDTVTAVANGPSLELIDSFTTEESPWDGVAIGPRRNQVLLKTRQQYRTVLPGVTTIQAIGPVSPPAYASVQVVPETDIAGLTLACPTLNSSTSQGGWAKLRVVDHADSLVSTVRITRWTISDGKIAELGNRSYYAQSSAAVFLWAKQPGFATLTARVGTRNVSCTVSVAGA